MNIPYCGECCFLSNGQCTILEREQRCSDQCAVRYNQITHREAERILHHYQKWRRGGKGPMPPPYVVGQAIDKSIKVLRK